MLTYPARYTQPLRVLAFDFGTRYIGVAYGQSLTSTAQPLDPLPARDGVPDWAQLEALVQRWQPDAFVVGLPWNMDDTESELLRRARRFGGRLEGRLHRPCYGMDERLTSFEARGELMHNAGERRAGRAGNAGHAGSADKNVDSVAARLILESWFAGLPPLAATD